MAIKMDFTPTKFTFVMADINIMKTREIRILNQECGYGGFYMYMSLAMMFANYDGCLGFAETNPSGKSELLAYEFSVVGTNLAVDKRLLQRLRMEGFTDDESEKFITKLMCEEIHLLYQRPDGFWALTGLTSDKSGPRLHIDDNIGYTGLLGNNMYLPLVIRGTSQTRDLSLPEPEPLPRIAYQETKEEIDGMTITELAMELQRKPSTLRQWIKRNSMAKYFAKVSKNKVLPRFLITDFIATANEKMSVEEFHEKWINAAVSLEKRELNENIVTRDSIRDMRDRTRDSIRDTCVTEENSEKQKFSINKPEINNVTHDKITRDMRDSIRDMRDMTRDTCVTEENSEKQKFSINKPNISNVTHHSTKNIRIEEYKNYIDDDDDDSPIREKVKDQIHYDQLKGILSETLHVFLDDIVDTCTDILLLDSEKMQINNSIDCQSALIKAQVKKLDYDKVLRIVSSIASRCNDISDRKRYFLTILYNYANTSSLSAVSASQKKKSRSSQKVSMPEYWGKEHSSETVSDERLAELEILQKELL